MAPATILIAIALIPLCVCALLVLRNIGRGRRSSTPRRTDVWGEIGHLSAGPDFVDLSPRKECDGPAEDAKNIRRYFDRAQRK